MLNECCCCFVREGGILLPQSHSATMEGVSVQGKDDHQLISDVIGKMPLPGRDW